MIFPHPLIFHYLKQKTISPIYSKPDNILKLNVCVYRNIAIPLIFQAKEQLSRVWYYLIYKTDILHISTERSL